MHLLGIDSRLSGRAASVFTPPPSFLYCPLPSLSGLGTLLKLWSLLEFFFFFGSGGMGVGWLLSCNIYLSPLYLTFYMGVKI